jgi:hypothetical protein
VLARRPIDAAVVGFSSGKMVPGKVWQVWMRFGNHTRAGTVPDRRGRCGMCFGEAGRCRSRLVLFALRQCAARFVAVRQCRFGCVLETKLVKARGRINAGSLGCIKACYVGFSSGASWQVPSRTGWVM